MGAVITELLAKYAGMERSFPVAENWKFSFLCTESEALQEPHLDYLWQALRRHDNTAEGMALLVPVATDVAVGTPAGALALEAVR